MFLLLIFFPRFLPGVRGVGALLSIPFSGKQSDYTLATGICQNHHIDRLTKIEYNVLNNLPRVVGCPRWWSVGNSMGVLQRCGSGCALLL